MARAIRPPESIREYYRDANVRARMLEYCGAEVNEATSCVFLVGLRAGPNPMPIWDADGVRMPPSAVTDLWDAECDIARSLWDRQGLVFLLDLDYQNVDVPGEPFLHPADVFVKLELAYRAVRRVLGRLLLHTHSIATGRGYHFTGRIPLTDPLIDQLAALAPETPPWHASVSDRLPVGVTASMTAGHARASVGLGLLIEHAAHLVLHEAQRDSPIPVVFNGTVVGPGPLGRECVSIDFSHVGDPLDVRHFRVAFSTCQFHRLRPDIVGAVASQVEPLVAVPRGQRSLMALLSAGRGLNAGLRRSRGGSIILPNVADGVRSLLQHYQASALATFHRRFYASQTTPVSSASVNWLALPPCVSAAFARPNDLLLKPEHIQHVVRTLIARDFSAAAIAALIRAKYEENHEWGDRWSRLDRRARTEFDVRVFAGMIATGLDSLVDFNCVSAQEKRLCPGTGCQFDLRCDQEPLRSLRAS